MIIDAANRLIEIIIIIGLLVGTAYGNVGEESLHKLVLDLHVKFRCITVT